MSDMTKEQRERMRQLASECYEKEMGLALEGLYRHFKRWKDGEISPRELNAQINIYYNGTARDLWNTFEQLNDPQVALSNAVIKGMINLEDVHEDCRPMLKGLIEAYRDVH